jgi:hypothetical protein
MVLEKLDFHKQKNEIGLLSYTIHKNQLQRDKRPETKTTRREQRGKAP